MKKIIKTFAVVLKIDKMTGLLKSQYINSTINGTLIAEATEETFSTYNGEVKIRGHIDSIIDGNGNNITNIIGGNDSLKDTIIQITSNIFSFKKDNKNNSTYATITLGPNSDSINLSAIIKDKTWMSFLYNNIEIIGSGTKISESIIDIETPINPNPDIPTDGSPRGLSTKEVFYGTVNFWMESGVQSQLPKFIYEVKRAGLTGTIIELLGPYKQFDTGEMSLDFIYEKYKQYVDAMNAAGLYTIVVHANWNSPYKHEKLSWFTNFADKIIEYSNNKLVIFQPSSEPGSSKDGSVERKKATDLHNYYVSKGLSPLVWNSNDDGVKRYEVFDTHVSKTSSIGSIVAQYNTTNTDHSLVLKELHDGNREGQKVNISKLKSHCEAALKGNTWYILYGFWHQTPDYDAIKALGEVFKNYKESENDGGAIRPPNNSIDDLDVSRGTTQISIRNKQQPNTAKITKTLESVSIRGSNAVLTYDKNSLSNWPQKSGEKTVNGKVHMMWVEGNTIYGGHMDWLGKGQTVKTMSNVTGGYFTKQPKVGDTIYFCIISLDGKERTNICKCSSKWKG